MKDWRVAKVLIDPIGQAGAYYEVESGRYYTWNEESSSWKYNNKRKLTRLLVPFGIFSVKISQSHPSSLKDFFQTRDELVREHITSRVGKLKVRESGLLVVCGTGPRELYFASEKIKGIKEKLYRGKYEVDLGMVFIPQTKQEINGLFGTGAHGSCRDYWCPDIVVW